jgi:hypothetical protein
MRVNLADGLTKGLSHKNKLSLVYYRYKCRWRSRRKFMDIEREIIENSAVNSIGFIKGNILMKNGVIGQRYY